MHKMIAVFLTMQICALGIISVAHAAQRRVALVIGNSAYEHAAPLKNPRNDAQEIAKKLTALGFDVVSGINIKHRQFARVIGTFKRKLAFSDVALFFYAGHGLQINGRNYLMPVDAQLDDETSLDFEAVQLNTVLRLMERSQRINLVFLDACRNNPMARNLSRSMGTRSGAVGRGLAPVESGVGTLIAYATQPGNVALDGDNANSPFTRALMKHISTPALDVALMMRRVRQDVIGETGGRQIPWQHSSLTTPFVFNEQAPKVVTRTARPLASSTSIELAFWQSATSQGTREAYQAYVEKFPNGNFTPLARIKLQQFQRTAALNARPPAPAPIMRNIEPPQPSSGSATQDTKAMSARQMARSLQSELTRVGCKPGKVDGKWGRRGARALSRFNKATGASLATKAPTMNALKVVKSHRRTICFANLRKKSKKAKLSNSPKPPKAAKPKKTKPKKEKRKTASVKNAKSGSRGKKCRYETLSACQDRFCAIGGTNAGCLFSNTASQCKKGGKYRRKTCR